MNTESGHVGMMSPTGIREVFNIKHNREMVLVWKIQCIKYNNCMKSFGSLHRCCSVALYLKL